MEHVLCSTMQHYALTAGIAPRPRALKHRVQASIVTHVISSSTTTLHVQQRTQNVSFRSVDTYVLRSVLPQIYPTVPSNTHNFALGKATNFVQQIHPTQHAEETVFVAVVS